MLGTNLPQHFAVSIHYINSTRVAIQFHNPNFPVLLQTLLRYYINQCIPFS